MVNMEFHFSILESTCSFTTIFLLTYYAKRWQTATEFPNEMAQINY